MEYITAKISKINDPKLKIIYWFSLSGLVISFVIGLFTNPEWMDLDVGVGNIQLEIEGAASSTFLFGKPGSQPKEWTFTSTVTYDAKELRIPNEESNSLFVATWISPHLPQSRSADTFCGDPTKPCNSDRECMQIHKSFFGEDLNVCKDFYCLIRAWCPIQFPSSFRQMDNVQNFEIFVKAVVSFPVFRTARRNYDANMNKVTSLNTFSIADMLDEVGAEYDEIKDKGIVISMAISFVNCIYHFTTCQPRYTFQRLDNEFGFSFLYNVYKPNMVVGSRLLPETRTTLELKGIRIVMSIQGGMHRFNAVGLLLSMGSLIGLLATAMAITDFVLLNIHPKRDRFVLQKYRFLENDRVVEEVDKELLKHLTNLGYY